MAMTVMTTAIMKIDTYSTGIPKLRTTLYATRDGINYALGTISSLKAFYSYIVKGNRGRDRLATRREGNYRLIEISTPETVGLAMLLLGLMSLLVSALYDSYVLAFVGLGLTFWGALLLLIMPTKHVKLELLTAVSSSLVANVEEMLNITTSNGKGIYLPPRLLRDNQSGLIFIPAKNGDTMPKREEVPTKGEKNSEGLFLTPPGLALSKLFERELGKPFTEVGPDQLTRKLPKLLEQLEITKNATFSIKDHNAVVEVRNHIFKDLCDETRKLERTYEAVGCPFSSAIACVLAKTVGKPVTIEKEEQSQDGKTTTFQYRILEE